MSDKSKSKRIGRTVLANSIVPKWPEIPQDDQTRVLDQLLRVAVQNKVPRVKRKKVERPAKRIKVSEAEHKEKKDKKELCLGINGVTRALENNELRMVVACGDVLPSTIISHLPYLCGEHGVPLCVLDNSSVKLGQSLGLKSLVALGVRRCKSGDTGSAFDDVVKVVSEVTPPVVLPWKDSFVPTVVERSEAKRLKKE